ncbi:UNVERIFIED_CONTAM: hypothetical protein GTU68_020012, partial [Idotea baltica]|nr:hypothetical protein [Idotea baltica]
QDGSKFHALKIIKKRLLRETKEVEHTKNEIKVLMKVDHPFVVHLEQFFTTVKRIFFVLEYVNGGELFNHLQHTECFSENRSMFYAAEICSALGYLHDQKIIYRDLKLENILLDLEGHIKLIDFGLSKDSLDKDGYTTSFCGTPEYMAPEVYIINIQI